MKKPTRPAPAARPAPGRGWLVPALAALLTVSLRLWFILSMRGQPFSTPSPQVIDSWYYYQQALAILDGDFWGRDVYFLRPLYQYLLALLGAKVLLVQLFQVSLAGLSGLLLWDTTRRVFNRAAAAVAAFGFALTGILVFYTGTLLYVELTIFLGLLVVWLLLVAGQRRWLWLLCGVAFGLLAICRPELLILLPLLFVWLLGRSTARPLDRSTVPPSATPDSSLVTRHFPWLMAASALLIIAAVPIRNFLVARDPVLFTAHSGINFYYGNNPDADGTWQPAGDLDRNVGFSHEQLKQVSRVIDGDTLSWSRASAWWMNKGLAFIFGHPLQYLKLLGRKLLLHLSNYEVPNNYYPDPVRASSLPLRLAFLDYGVILAFGILGMVMSWPLRRKAVPLYFVSIAFLLSSLAFYVLSRLRAPVIPFLLIFAGFAVSELWSALRHRQTRRLASGLGLAALICAGSHLIPVDSREYAAQGYTQLGNVWLEMSKPVPARVALEQTLRLDSTNVSARYSMVELMAAAGRKQEAAAHLRALARDAAGTAGGNTLVQMASARVAIAWRDFPVAVATYQTLLAQHPDNAQAWYMLGLVYTSTGDLDLAADALTRACDLDPSNSNARSALVRVRQRLGP